MAKVDTVREYLGEVTLLSGDKIKVYMPTVGDAMDIKTDLTSMRGIFQLSAMAVGMTFDEFKELAITDGHAIADKLSDAILTLSNLERKRPNE